MKKFAPKPPAQMVPAKIFRIEVREDANEVGLVVAYPNQEDPTAATVKGQKKIFPNEKSKLSFLANARQKGFRNFGLFSGKLDIERMVLEELVRRNKMEESEEARLDSSNEQQEKIIPTEDESQ